jgi:DNA mismatch endonuclease (patch repair protein)
MDTLTAPERSARMARIRGKNTAPEMTVRRMVHGLGYRYRLHAEKLPGRPDLVFGPRRKVIFVHGCFWHRHDDPLCKVAHLPKSRLEFWRPKLKANRDRDSRNQELLRAAGWKCLVLWECELGDPSALKGRLQSFLG